MHSQLCRRTSKVFAASFVACALSLAGVGVVQAQGPDGGAGAGAGTAAAAKPGLDVSKMPFTEFSIKQVVQYHAPSIQKCYEGVIADMGKNPPEGRVMVAFNILPSGLTTQVKVDKKKSSIKNERVQDCVADDIRSWEFPKPTDGREHPIVFPFDLKVTK
jgi:hypothetical protein